MREITIACGDYDRTALLKQHRAPLDGAPYHYIPLTPAETFWRMIRYAEFDVCEMSLGSYCTAVGQGDERFIAIPVFPSRAFRHGNLFVGQDSPFTTPSDLKGKRIGVAEYEMTAGVWIRGFLQDDYAVDARSAEWVTGREAKAAGVPYDPAIKVTVLGNRNLEAAVANGEIDAVATAPLPPQLGKGIRRLIPNYAEVEEAYFRRTHVFPIMHTLVMRREVYDQYPFLARSLFKAFTQAKQAAYQHMYRTNALPYAMPWMISLIERTQQIMGSDPWPYGIEPNLPTLNAFLRYLCDQGLTRRLLTIDELFLPGQWTNALA